MKIKDEKRIEAYLKRRVEQAGGLCLKYECNGTVGYPDRLCTLDGGRIVWVEVKAEGEKPRKMQVFRHRQLVRHGQEVAIVASYDDVDELISRYYDVEQI